MPRAWHHAGGVKSSFPSSLRHPTDAVRVEGANHRWRHRHQRCHRCFGTLTWSGSSTSERARHRVGTICARSSGRRAFRTGCAPADPQAVKHPPPPAVRQGPCLRLARRAGRRHRSMIPTKHCLRARGRGEATRPRPRAAKPFMYPTPGTTRFGRGGRHFEFPVGFATIIRPIIFAPLSSRVTSTSIASSRCVARPKSRNSIDPPAMEISPFNEVRARSTSPA